MITNRIKAEHLSNFQASGRDYDVHFVENLEELASFQKNFVVIGNGTNSLFINKQELPFVSLIKLNTIRYLGKNIIEADAGILLPKLITELKKKQIGGLEFTYPVPATLGAAVYQNFGAFGKELGPLVKKVSVYNKTRQQFYIIDTSNTADYFSYRNSYFKENNLLITKITLDLKTILIQEINKQLKLISEKRQSVSPIKKTLGSIFMNTPEYTAGKLLDQAGLKGTTHNGAYVSSQHANIIINQSANATDIYKLIQIMKQTVKKHSRVALQEEVFIY